ncbi:flavodoxin family protein [Clostridium lundense]|uniref:flavodoxin family protein n=1 Tax=Clostridium lundense TaxID=319475 RepID=UPI0004812EEE|nr:flavodoxin family protein [Clostridium lundense]
MQDKRILVVYYSRTGTTKNISKIIGEKLSCSIEEIYDVKNRDGLMGFLKGGREGLKKNITVIKPIKKDPSMFNLIIIGTPVWASHLSPAIRTYINENHLKFKNVAFFYTQKGSASNKVFDDMRELIGKSPVATLKIDGKDFKDENYINKINEFTNEIFTNINEV